LAFVGPVVYGVGASVVVDAVVSGADAGVLDFVGPATSGAGALRVVGGHILCSRGDDALAFAGPATSGSGAWRVVAGRALSGPGALAATVGGILDAGRAPAVLLSRPVRLLRRFVAVE